MPWPDEDKKYLPVWMVTLPQRYGPISFARKLTDLARPPYVETSLPRKEKHMPKAIMDLTELLERVENDRELIRELLLIFKEEFPIHLLALRDAVDSMDGKRVAVEAHNLWGMLSNLAASSAADAAARLERLGRNQEVSEFQAACTSFENLSKELLLELETCMAEVCG
jgi:HPt (histidine-containing phosphotransfer) domain-containing protein